MHMLSATKTRLGMVISGARPSVERAVVSLLTTWHSPQIHHVLWLANTLSEGVEAALSGVLQVRRGDVRRYLGSETDILVVDCFDGFNPDAIAGLAGTIRRVGAFILLTPPLDEWPHYSDPEYRHIAVEPYEVSDISGYFLQRIARLVARYGDEGRFCCVDPEGVDTLPSLREIETESCPAGSAPSVGQQAVISAFAQVCEGHRHRPLVLTADRGRGKSAAVGMAVAQMMRTHPHTFLVTAPSKAAVATLFFHCANALGVDCDLQGDICFSGARLTFCLPDRVEAEGAGANVLVVDEAAAIGTPLLSRWLGRFPRMVFITTVHGYEGSGRGFALRFSEQLVARTPQYKALHLTDPIRWNPGDEVEAFVNDAFLLGESSQEQGGEREGLGEGKLQITRLDRCELMADDNLLASIFGLLINAHYKTTPGDLRNLLDGPNLSVFVACVSGVVVGALLAAEEGGFDDALQQDIWQGRRRPRGHVLPQTLAVQCGYEAGLAQTSLRVIRIAVANGSRRHGVGLRLVEEAKVFARQRHCHWLGTSFGATEPLVLFWRKAGLWPVRVGVSLDVASGSYSSLLLAPLGEAAAVDLRRLRKHFFQHFQFSLAQHYREMPATLVACMCYDDEQLPVCADQQVLGFLHYQRPYDVTYPALCQWFLGNLRSIERMMRETPECFADVSFTLLVELLVRRQTVTTVADRWGKGGEKAFLKRLKNTLMKLNENISRLHDR